MSLKGFDMLLVCCIISFLLLVLGIYLYVNRKRESEKPTEDKSEEKPLFYLEEYCTVKDLYKEEDAKMDKVDKIAKKKRLYLYKMYGQGYWGKYNRERIDYVIDKVYKKQLRERNSCEERVRTRLKAKGFDPWWQYLIPIVSEGGKLEHLYIADFLVGKTLIEIDGQSHDSEYDAKRDLETSKLGYTTIRIPTIDLSTATIDRYLNKIVKL